MGSGAGAAFESEIRTLRMASILPLRAVTSRVRSTPRYRSIKASIDEIGLVEPLVVFPEDRHQTSYILLDGHLRYDVLKKRGDNVARCLISTDDESFTYNRHISRLNPVQEHKMIIRAVERGVSPERIARALAIDIATVRAKQNLLRGIAPEVAEILGDKQLSPIVFRVLRKMKPFRQIEAAELMVAANKFSVAYARALLAGTPKEHLVEAKGRLSNGVTAADIARIESELQSLKNDYKVSEERFGETMLNLVVTKGYVNKLLHNAAVDAFLRKRYSEIHEELQDIVSAIESTAEEA